jgi:hypothetical protein
MVWNESIRIFHEMVVSEGVGEMTDVADINDWTAKVISLAFACHWKVRLSFI